MKKFEYKVEFGKFFSESYLSKLGRDGWELVAVLPNSQKRDYYFKRETT